MATSSDRGSFPEREQLIESHLPLVRAIARRYEGRGEPLEDLVQVGSIALVRASNRFDPERGVAFATFVTPAVEGEIRRHLSERSPTVRIPREVRRMSGRLERARAELAVALGRAPSVGELAAALEVEPEEIERADQAGMAREPSEVPEDAVGAAGSPASLQATDDRLLLAAGSRVLDDRERRIVLLRFHADMTEREIARELGISQAQVSRVLSRALSKLREELEDKNLVKGTADTTQKGVISTESSVAEIETGGQTGRSSRSSEPPETRIDPVGALDEQAQPAEAPQTGPGVDLALPYHVTVKPEGADPGSGWVASFEELPGSVARGATADQAVENLRSVMESWLSAAVDEPKVISPPKRPSKGKKGSGHSGRFLVRMPSELHEELTRAAEREEVSLNRFVTTQLAASVASSKGAASVASSERAAPVASSKTASAEQKAGSKAEAAPAPSEPAERPQRNLRLMLAANVLIMVIAAAAAIVLLVLALERGI